MIEADELLLDRLRQREEDAFNEIVRLYGDKVFSLVFRLLGNRSEAEDIAQEVFVTVFKSVDTFRGEAKFTTWLLRIAVNHAKNRIKYLGRRPNESGGLESVPDAPSRLVAPDAALEAAELEDIMQKAINALGEEQRVVLLLRDVEELSYEEICEITGLAEGTVKSRLHRARMALKDHLEENVK